VHLIGISALRARYARSALGQMWLTLTTLLQIVILGFVWSKLWGQDVDEFLPYLGIGLIIFSFYTHAISEGASVFVADARYYMNDKMPFIVSTFAHIYRGVIILIHNVPVILLLVLWSRSAHFSLTLLYVPALLLSLVFALFSSYIVSAVCAVFRDLAQIVGIAMYSLFFLTPIMWDPAKTQLQKDGRIYALLLFNPLASVMEILRNPLIGREVDPKAYLILAGWTVVLAILARIVYGIFNRRIIFWI